MARKTKTAIEMPEEKPDFEAHLAKLYDYFGPKLDESVDPPEVILSGMARTDPCELTFDQLQMLNLQCMRTLGEISQSTEKLDKLTFKDKVAAFVDWLRQQSFEAQVLSLRTGGHDHAIPGEVITEIVEAYPELSDTVKCMLLR